jgi:hypothetical protein
VSEEREVLTDLTSDKWHTLMVRSGEYQTRAKEYANRIESLEYAISVTAAGDERAELQAELEEVRGAHQRLEERIAAVATEDEAHRRAAAAMTPATREARAELARLERDGDLEPWQATALREVFTEVETAFLAANTKLAEVLRLAVEQTAAVATARREEQRKLTTSEKIAKWNDVKCLSRSRMSAAMKSSVIRAFGLQAYNSLPR